MSAKKSKILGPGIWVQQKSERYQDKRGKVYRWNDETKKVEFLYAISKYQFMALLRHHISWDVSIRYHKDKWDDWTVVGDLDAFYAEDEWKEQQERENRSTPLYLQGGNQIV